MKAQDERGYTLAELVIVIAILGLVAAVAIPATSPSTEKLDLAASEFAAAMRFARSEAIRTGEPHGFNQQSSAKRIRAFRLDQGTIPATPIYDVYHPIDKQLYDIDLNQQSLATADSLILNVVFRGACNQTENIYFDGHGTPWCTDPDDILLDQFGVTLVFGSSVKVVTTHGITGRVTVQ